MQRTVLALTLPLLVVAGACGSGSETASKPAAHVEPQITDIATAACGVAFRCCSRGEIDWYVEPYIAADDCATRFLEHATLSPGAALSLEPLLGLDVMVPNVAALDRAVYDGRTKVDQKALKTCLDYLGTVSCNKYQEPKKGCVAPDPPPPKTPCDPHLLFVGLVGEGGRCSSALGSFECADGLGCSGSADLGVWGQCVHVSTVGEHCIEDSECAEDLYCSQLDGTCQAYRQEGETCDFANRDDPSPDPATALVKCRSDLSCDPLSDTCVVACTRGAKCISDADCDKDQQLECIQGRCDIRRAVGLPCSTDGDCLEDLRCESDPANPTQMICAERSPLGTPCNYHDDCASGFCDPTIDRCAAPVPAGSLCPTGEDQQCDNGRCVTEFTFCSSDTDCPNSGKCNLSTFECESYCVALLPEGANCTSDTDCASGACAAGYCRTLPLADGQQCDQSYQCDSEFCSLDTSPVCKELPLPLGEPCSSASQCDSGVCFGGSSGKPICVSGLDLGEECGKSGQAPCNPKKFYCDSEQDPAVCVPLLETGQACTNAGQCRGSCVLHGSRMQCSPAAAPKAAVCDGP